jgi:hypothetical protein
VSKCENMNTKNLRCFFIIIIDVQNKKKEYIFKTYKHIGIISQIRKKKHKILINLNILNII